ncbi:MAG: hypothetical protein HY788_17660 [Deltaproteobacteria bacterium]|nr:hypothetical protein [Deltaproteobacteria bacterium]
MRRHVLFALVISLCLFPGTASADVSLPPGYSYEVFAAVLPGTVPYGMRIDTGDNLFLSVYETNSVYKVTPEGGVSVFISAFQPMGIDFDASGNIYIGRCINNNSIAIFDPSGTMIGSVNPLVTFRSNPYPGQVTLDDAGNIFTAIETIGVGGSRDSVLQIGPPPARTRTIYQLANVDGSNVLDIAVSSSGSVYSANCFGTDLAEIDPVAGTKRTVAQIPWVSGLLFDTVGFFDGSEDLFVAQWIPGSPPVYRILRVDVDNGFTVHPFAENMPIIRDHYGPRLMDFNTNGDLYVSIDGYIYRIFKTPTNQPPVANAGPDIEVLSANIQYTVIAGTAMDEDETDLLEYRWVEGDTVL